MPSESTFSRAFETFARDGRPQQIHEAMLKTHYGDKLAGHVSRDATAIHAREKTVAKTPDAGEPKPRKRGRRRKGEPPLRHRNPPDCNGNSSGV